MTGLTGCAKAEKLIRGLEHFQIHASESAWMLLDVIREIQTETVSEHKFQSVFEVFVDRLFSVMPPYGPLINTVCAAFQALDNGIPVASYVEAELRGSQLAFPSMQEICGRLLDCRESIITHTFSKTLSDCFASLKQRGLSFQVSQTESGPNEDGHQTYRKMQEHEIACRILLDADAEEVVRKGDIAVFGCEAVLPDGRIIGKVGQSLVSRLCLNHRIPVYIYAGKIKLLSPQLAGFENLIRMVCSPDKQDYMEIRLFDVTPAEAVSGIITESGILPPDAVSGFARQDVSPSVLHLLSKYGRS